MLRTLAVLFLAGAFLGFSPLVAGQEPTIQSKLLSSIPPEQLQALEELRAQADKEVFKDHAKFAWPEIAFSLQNPRYIVALAEVTAVTPEALNANQSDATFRVDLDLKQILRGESEKMHVYTESRWRPIKSGFRLGRIDTVLDREQPRVGNLYLLGYAPPGYGEDGTRIMNAVGIDFSVPGQAQTFAEVQHFLNIEASGDAYNFVPFMAALDDSVPWIRDIAAHRLAESDACHASAACGKVFLDHVREHLQSKSARERYDALEWLGPIVAEAHIRKQPSSIANEACREILASATADPNVLVGDHAYQYLSDWDSARSLQPGHCLEVVALIRKSTVWDYDGVKRVGMGRQGSSITCLPPMPAP